MLGSAGVVTDVLPEAPTFAIAASSPPPGNAPSCAGSDEVVVDVVLGRGAEGTRAGLSGCSAIDERAAPVGSAPAATGVADHATDSAANNADVKVKLRRTDMILEANSRSDTPL
jgi:hypothetical protein